MKQYRIANNNLIRTNIIKFKLYNCQVWNISKTLYIIDSFKLDQVNNWWRIKTLKYGYDGKMCCSSFLLGGHCYKMIKIILSTEVLNKIYSTSELADLSFAINVHYE
jgi:hypothetical protein